jgi:hypothetical protein
VAALARDDLAGGGAGRAGDGVEQDLSLARRRQPEQVAGLRAVLVVGERDGEGRREGALCVVDGRSPAARGAGWRACVRRERALSTRLRLIKKIDV